MCFVKETERSAGPSEDLSQARRGWQPCLVETYSGYRVHERPRRFACQGGWLEVNQVLAGWREPESLCFTVAANDSRHYLLKYHHHRDAWEVRIWRDSSQTPA